MEKLNVMKSFVPVWVQQKSEIEKLRLNQSHTQNMNAVVFFLDISGFSKLADRMSNLSRDDAKGEEELTNVLNSYFSKLLSIIEKYCGDVVKFAGDAVFSLWYLKDENPTKIQETMIAASRCALEIQSQMGVFTHIDVTLTCKICISVGPVDLNVLTTEDRAEFLVTGGALDVVAQMEHYAEVKKVIVDDASLEKYNLRHLFSQLNPIVEAPNTHLPFKLFRIESINNSNPVSQTPYQCPIRKLIESEKVDPDLFLKMMKRFVPREVFKRIDSVQLLTELRKISVIFVRINKPPHGHEKFSLEDLSFVFNSLNTELNKLDGAMRQFLQDDKGLVCIGVFGLTTHENDSYRSVSFALKLCSLFPDSLSMGVTRGYVFVGPVGSEKRREFAFVGDTVNMSARLMSACVDKQIPILVDSVTHSETLNLPTISYGEQYALKVKGKTIEFPGFAPILKPTTPTLLTKQSSLSLMKQEQTQQHQQNQQSQHPHIDQEPKRFVVGREKEETAILTQIRQTIANKSSALITINGEAGIGKSELTLDILTSLAKSPETIQVLQSGANEIHRNLPYYSWANIFQNLLESRRLQIRSVTKENLSYEQMISEIFAPLAQESRNKSPNYFDPEYFVLLNLIIGTEFEAQEGKVIDSSEAQQATIVLLSALLVNLLSLDALHQQLEHQKRRTGVVIVLEDLHWLDESSWMLLSDILFANKIPCLVFLCTSRPMLHASDFVQVVMQRASVFKLDQLSKTETETLIRVALNVSRVLPVVVDLIFDRSAGNPLFTKQLLLSFLSHGQIIIVGASTSDSYARLSEELLQSLDHASLSLPSTISAVVLNRFDQLDSRTQVLLKACSILGASIRLDLLSALVGRAKAEEEFVDDLQQLVSREFLDGHVREAGTTLTPIAARHADRTGLVRFRHILIGEAIYHSITFSQRRELHSKAGKWIISHAGASSELSKQALTVAFHFERAEDLAQSIEYYEMAGDRSYELKASLEAMDSYTNALRLTDLLLSNNEKSHSLSTDDIQTLKSKRISWLRKMVVCATTALNGPLQLSSYERLVKELGYPVIKKQSIQEAWFVLSSIPLHLWHIMKTHVYRLPESNLPELQRELAFVEASVHVWNVLILPDCKISPLWVTFRLLDSCFAFAVVAGSFPMTMAARSIFGVESRVPKFYWERAQRIYAQNPIAFPHSIEMFAMGELQHFSMFGQKLDMETITTYQNNFAICCQNNSDYSWGSLASRSKAQMYLHWSPVFDLERGLALMKEIHTGVIASRTSRGFNRSMVCLAMLIVKDFEPKQDMQFYKDTLNVLSDVVAVQDTEKCISILAIEDAYLLAISTVKDFPTFFAKIISDSLKPLRQNPLLLGDFSLMDPMIRIPVLQILFQLALEEKVLHEDRDFLLQQIQVCLDSALTLVWVPGHRLIPTYERGLRALLDGNEKKAAREFQKCLNAFGSSDQIHIPIAVLALEKLTYITSKNKSNYNDVFELVKKYKMKRTQTLIEYFESTILERKIILHKIQKSRTTKKWVKRIGITLGGALVTGGLISAVVFALSKK